MSKFFALPLALPLAMLAAVGAQAVSAAERSYDCTFTSLDTDYFAVPKGQDYNFSIGFKPHQNFAEAKRSRISETVIHLRSENDYAGFAGIYKYKETSTTGDHYLVFLDPDDECSANRKICGGTMQLMDFNTQEGTALFMVSSLPSDAGGSQLYQMLAQCRPAKISNSKVGQDQ